MVQFPTDVSVAIISYNSRTLLPETLESLHQAGCPSSQITVVDVASTDGTQEWLAEEWNDVNIIRLASNNGPNPARNSGIENAKTPYVLLMDSDVSIKSDTVSLLRKAFDEDPDVGIGSPVVVYDSRPDIVQYAGTGVHFLCEGFNPYQGKSVKSLPTTPQDIGCASGCALLILRSAALKVNLFDERYFFGKTDGDFTHRISLAGYKIKEIPQARVLHRKRERGTIRYYHQILNRWHFMLKNYQISTLFVLSPILIIHEFLQFAMLLVKGHGLTYIKAIWGLVKMLPELPRDRANVAKFRARKDRDLLLGGPFVVGDEIISNSLIQKVKELYDKILIWYWRFIVGGEIQNETPKDFNSNG